MCEVARLGHGSRRDEGPSDGRWPGHWIRSGCWTRSVRFNIIWPDWLRARRFIRCRNAMPTSTLSAELGAGLARWRGAADAPASQETAATLAATRQDPFETTWPRVVEWLEAEPHRTAEGALRPSAAGAPGDVPPGPAPDSAAPRQGLASSRRPSSRVCRSDRSVPRRCCVTEPRRRFERLSFRLSAIDLIREVGTASAVHDDSRDAADCRNRDRSTPPARRASGPGCPPGGRFPAVGAACSRFVRDSGYDRLRMAGTSSNEATTSGKR